jgi:uncharacterized protein YkwD
MLRALAVGAVVLAFVAPSAQAGELEHDVLVQMNEARADHGLAPVRQHDGLAGAADDQSRWMAENNVMGHRPDLLSRLEPAAPNYRLWGENLAWMPGRRGVARRAVRAWLHSPPHRRLLLRKGLDVSGVGIATRGRAFFITATFAGR